MRIKIQQFLFYRPHSWADVGKFIGREFLRFNHDVEFISTDGFNKAYVPKFAEPYVKAKPNGEYDLQLSYTAMQNFPYYLVNGKTNRFGIYNYDGSILPNHWVKYHQFVDKLLPSSEYAKRVFLDAKVPESKIEVVPHGVDVTDFNVEPYKFKTKKTIKILNVCGQVHRRKNLPGILEAYGKAFTKKDDVCLILKVIDKKPEFKFEVLFKDIYNKWRSDNKNGPDVEIITQYVDSIESLFVACDIHFSLSNIECFHIPSLQSMAAGKLTIQSNYGGHVDFMNVNNSLLVDGVVERCPTSYQYWTPSSRAILFAPNKNDAAEKLRYAVNNYDSLMEKFVPEMKKTVDRYTWANVANKILSMAK
jgi:glycosyltransferase involved in cell wall biosynthesis